MARESIYTMMRPGFPKEIVDQGAYRVSIEYVGKKTDLENAAPLIGSTWGEYTGRVANVALSPMENNGHATLIVELERKFESADYSFDGGELTETNYEEEWVCVNRPLLEHPAFAVGYEGANALTSEDISAIEAWKNEEDVSKKKDFKYKTSASSSYSDLSTNAKMYARGVQLGCESWDDFVPVIRVTSVYLNGKPPNEEAGQKDSPPPDADGPSGYEWRKSGARRIHTGGQNRWELIEEWTGCKKVLLDKDEIFWSAP